MTDDELLRALRSVGFDAYVTYFDLLNGNLANNHAAETLHIHTGWTLKGCKTRVSKARSIASANATKRALTMIVQAEKIADDVRAMARRYLLQL